MALRRGLGGFVGLMLLLAALSAQAGSAAAAGWLPQVNVSSVQGGATTSDLSAQDVAVDGEGNAIAVWVQSGGAEVLEAATRPPGGVWSEPVEVSEAGEEVLEIQVEANSDGEAVAVWTAVGGGEEIVRAAIRSAGGEWSEPVAISDLDDHAGEPVVAIDEEGNVTALWVQGEINSYGVVAGATLTAGGEWSEPLELSDGLASTPQVAVDPEGEVTAVWTLHETNREDGVIESRTRSAGGDWSAEAVVVSGAGALAREPAIAVDAQGDATVVWRRQDIPGPNGIHTFVQTAERVDGTWTDPFTLSKEDGLADDADVAVDPQGNATAIWSYWGTARFVQARSRTAAGAWGETVTLSAKSGMLEPEEGDLQVVADAAGNVTALWQSWLAPNPIIRSASLPVGGGWTTPLTLSAAGSYALWPQMAVDPQGYVTAVWSGVQASTQAVRSRVFDAVGPEFLDVTVPAGAVAGQRVTMSVQPVDLWSPVTTSWDFGDDKLGTSEVVEHCFGLPGERTVTVAATDIVGNVTSATRPISIAADPAIPPGVNACGPPPPPNPPLPFDPPPPGVGPGPDLGPVAPVISTLRQASRRWRLPGAGSGSRLPVGTSFRFRLDRPAAVRLEILRLVPGRKPQARGTLRMNGNAGANVYRFKGKIRGRTLAPGRYRVLVSASADGKTSAVASLGFTIVR